MNLVNIASIFYKIHRNEKLIAQLAYNINKDITWNVTQQTYIYTKMANVV